MTVGSVASAERLLEYGADPIGSAWTTGRRGSRGFRPYEIREIATILEDHKNDLMAAWYAEEAKRGDSSGKNSDG